MSLDRFSLKYKIWKIGGFRAICGKHGKDLYLTLLIGVLYLAIIRANSSILNWWITARPNMSFVLAPIAVLVALIGVIFKLRHDVITDTSFNKRLEINDFLVIVEFFYDYPLDILYLSIIIWIIFSAIWFVSSEGTKIATGNIFVAYAFVVPFSCFAYGFFNFYYCIKATQIYKGLEIQYSKKR